MARRGRVVPEIGLPDFREIVHAPYRVIYRIDVASVAILTLRHWRRSWDPGEVEDGAKRIVAGVKGAIEVSASRSGPSERNRARRLESAGGGQRVEPPAARAVVRPLTSRASTSP